MKNLPTYVIDFTHSTKNYTLLMYIYCNSQQFQQNKQFLI